MSVARRRCRAAVLLAAVLCMASAAQAQVIQLAVATVDNGQMLQLRELGVEFERVNPHIRLNWVTLEEQGLRRAVASDLSTGSGQFDVVTIGPYEAALWPQRGWLKPIRPAPAYAPEDLLPGIRAGVTREGRLYGAPFYGESSMLMYRKDLMRKAGLTMPPSPSWRQVAGFAARLHDPAHGIYGICLRGRPGWGMNMALVTTMVNTHGGQWFDMDWRPQLDSAAWHEAVALYVGLLRRHGPPNAARLDYNGNLKLFQEGKCALWLDASVAAGFVRNPALSRYAGEVGFAPAPVARTRKGSSWLWTWSFAIPAHVSGPREQAAQRFVNWASSREYVRLVGRRVGWRMVPGGTRASTYAEPAYVQAAPWSRVELAALASADPRDATLPKSPYKGVQFAAIPAFQAIGDEVGELISKAVAGRLSVEDALAHGQRIAQWHMDLDAERR